MLCLAKQRRGVKIVFKLASIRDSFKANEGKQALGWLAGLFQRNHLIDFAAKDLPELNNYKLLSQQRDNFINQHEYYVAQAYQDMEKKLNKKVMHELVRVQGMATRLDDFDPATFDTSVRDMNEEEAEVYQTRLIDSGLFVWKFIDGRQKLPASYV